jgi:hypothetical protein
MTAIFFITEDTKLFRFRYNVRSRSLKNSMEEIKQNEMNVVKCLILRFLGPLLIAV